MHTRDEHLSEHLTIREVFKYSVDITDEQFFLARALATNVFEPIRHLIGLPIRVTDGERDQSRHDSLYQRGYHPSKTTDHSFGNPLNPYGVGAIDLLPVDGEGGDQAVRPVTENEYGALVEFFKREPDDVLGQLIWYPVRGHIHVSNPKSLLYSAAAIERIPIRVKRRFFVYPE